MEPEIHERMKMLRNSSEKLAAKFSATTLTATSNIDFCTCQSKNDVKFYAAVMSQRPFSVDWS